jgi:hypothetical protein
MGMLETTTLLGCEPHPAREIAPPGGFFLPARRSQPRGLAPPQCRHGKAPHADAARLALHAFTLLLPLEKFMVQLLALLLSKVYNRVQERPRVASPHIFLPRIASPHIFLLKFVFLLMFL